MSILIEEKAGLINKMGWCLDNRRKFGPDPAAALIFSNTQGTHLIEAKVDPLREETETTATLLQCLLHAKFQENTEPNSYAKVVRNCDAL
ncbi:hypothetical protein HAX54_031264, partial [Datura stramonium]|nr:hypothetical protein [Datura stramonium]